MLKSYRIADTKLLEIDEIQAPVMVFINPDEKDKKFLVEKLCIDEHTLASSLDPDELSRIEFEPEHLAVILKRPRNYSSEYNFLFKVSSTGIFLFKERIIIVLPEDVVLFDGKIFNRVLSLEDVLLKVIYRTIFHFLEHLKVINAISDALEQKINASMENKYLINLFSLEKSLVYYLNAINSNGYVIERMKLNAAKVGLGQEHVELIDDIIIENSQCYKQAEIYSNILASLMDARVSIVSNNLNILMKTLNIITIGIMVPTFVVSVFSMNVAIPFQKNNAGFWIILGLCFISVAFFLGVWRRSQMKK